MISIEILLNGVYKATHTFNDSVKIDDILEKSKLEKYEIIAAKKNNAEYLEWKEEIKQSCAIDLVSVNSSEGFLIYQDTAIMIMMKAFHSLFPNKYRLVIEHSIGSGIYGEVFGGYVLMQEDVDKLKTEMEKIITADQRIDKLFLTSSEAEEIFQQFNRDDILKNLKRSKIRVFKCGNYYDYFIRDLAPSTGYVKIFDLVFHAPGLILKYPERSTMEINYRKPFPKNLFSTHQEHDKWLNILGVHFVSTINRKIKKYKLTEIILIEEALHENKIVNIAEEISHNKDAKVVLIAGPSSSGKTTFAKRLSIQLRVLGIFPHIIGMDNYFLPREKTPLKENGEKDYESIKAIDLELLNQHLHTVLSGDEIVLPKYNFVAGKREKSNRKLRLFQNDVLIMEGIHGLNDELTKSVPFNQKLKIYVSALNNLSIDAHNRIPTNDTRKIRRIIRDHNFRGHTAEQTLKMWNSVRAGEDRNIFPFQENADFMFNSILTYELGVLKKYVAPLLSEIDEYSSVYLEAQRLKRILHHFANISDEMVPTNSILREFIGGSIFKY
ncbi:MAG: nucleoside kinase [Candidatus Cloacimonadota bacterium]|nr:nucleoside kinase [Candidatus Cloacimonadota bacterium]